MRRILSGEHPSPTPRETSGHIVVASEREGKINSLLDKLHRWVQGQPEWLDLMLEDRQTRRRVADLVAKELLKLPVRSTTGEPNRSQRREIVKMLMKREHKH